MRRNPAIGLEELAAAAVATYKRVDALAEASRAQPRIVAMLQYIRQHLFDPDLKVGLIKKACGIRDNSVVLLFHSEIGKTPHNFITKCRLEVADRLLARTTLPIWRLTELLGYSSIQVFSRSYQRARGQRPGLTRRRASSLTVLPPPSPPTAAPNLLDEALAGRLDQEAAGNLIRRLLDIYPPQARRMQRLPDY